VARQWCQRNSNSPNKVFVKLDFANAFNTIDREFFLKEVRDHMPGLAAWADFCYSSPSNLVFGSRTIGSECGVQQGDPLGPLFFSLALQPVLQELARSRVTGGLELVYSYLDDLCLAGDAHAVATAIATLKQRCSDIGLRLSTGTPADKGKCETVLVGQAASTVDVRLFPQDFNIVRDGNFELLGGPIGSAEFCNRHTQSRVTKAARVLEALGELPDPQVALQLLRRCGAFSKMVFSARVVPASFHTEALASFDAQVRACFEQFSCLHPDEDQWAQATLNNDSGGLGLRSLVKHSHAAYLASRSSCFKLCRELDPEHVFEFPQGAGPSPERVSHAAYNASVNSDACLGDVSAEPWSQKALSKAIDERTLAELSASAGQSRRAHLKLISASGAGLWLNATPSKAAQLNNDPALFVAMLRRWLRVPFADQDVECPCCGGVLDSFGDHALVCSCGGDRTRRHNLLRNVVFHASDAANLRPELEKEGLLPQRPLDGGAHEDGSPCTDHNSQPQHRRPADVFIPRWRSGPPAAWDFAVTSGLRIDRLADALAGSDTVCAKYEDFKYSHQDTRSQCLAQGITFIPMVMEAVGGGWGKLARCVWSELAKSSALAMGELESNSTCAIMLRQRLSLTLHRENARACLKRFGA